MVDAENNYIARKLSINGIVQGVGFRPFVYQLANRYGIKGEVANTSSGVSIHIEGDKRDIEPFLNELAGKGPPLAHITDLSVQPETVEGYTLFSIAKSKGRAKKSTLISPDMSICEDCLKELFRPEDRRYGYPFINCTNCGPRYTIIDDIPYDRPNTSMKHFKMCNRCQSEYDDPVDRRFHAQPNACAECGPHVALYDNNGTKSRTGNPIAETAELLRLGFIVAIKGLGGFHLAADAENNDAVVRLRKRKHREEKPFALMSYDVNGINRYAIVEPEEKVLLSSPRRPIVILNKRLPNSISGAVAPRNDCFGAMLPYTPLHYLLLSYGFTALVMTSGNLSEEPIAIDNGDAFDRLSNIAEYFLIHNRDIYLRSDDSIVRRSAGATRFIRRSRGYVPIPVFLKKKVRPALACGAELKNTVCLTRGKNAFLSQYIGDLENLAAYRFFTMTIDHMKRILDIEPEILACDLHPDYLSTRYAQEQEGIEKIQVQHHHAHIVSCMSENGLEGQMIGLALDGTGYGTDGCIWGGEVLVADAEEFRRAGHLSYVPMPGSAAAIKEPWRMAVSYLHDTFGDDLWNLNLPLLNNMDEKKIRIIVEMISKKINSPSTSSIGRLFDGIASLVGIRNEVFFEGQAAMELEMLAGEQTSVPYDYEWAAGDVHRLRFQPIISSVVHDIEKGIEPAEISSRFHMTLIQAFAELCQGIRIETGLNRVALSGGVFQNSLFLSGIIKALEEKEFEVFSHRLVPTNDGGISLGQAVIAEAVSGR